MSEPIMARVVETPKLYVADVWDEARVREAAIRFVHDKAERERDGLADIGVSDLVDFARAICVFGDAK